MIKEELKFDDDKLFVYTSLPQYDEGVCKVQLVMTKEIFQECYKKWIEPQESEKETSYTPKEVRNILIKEGWEHGSHYGLKLGDIIKFSPTEVEQILMAESEVQDADRN